jgi:glycine/D-amino acid oxidase-like deaminating enzyme
MEDCGRWLLPTSDASIAADCVILANNALVKALGYLRDRLIAIYIYAAMTEPISRGDDRNIGAAAWGVLPTHRFGTASARTGFWCARSIPMNAQCQHSVRTRRSMPAFVGAIHPFPTSRGNSSEAAQPRLR